MPFCHGCGTSTGVEAFCTVCRHNRAAPGLRDFDDDDDDGDYYREDMCCEKGPAVCVSCGEPSVCDPVCIWGREG